MNVSRLKMELTRREAVNPTGHRRVQRGRRDVGDETPPETTARLIWEPSYYGIDDTG
jgi:hypothetical protein